MSDSYSFCPECSRKGKSIVLRDGKVLAPLWGRLDGRPIYRGDTLNQVSSVLVNCEKCPECGYSRIHTDKLLTADKYA